MPPTEVTFQLSPSYGIYTAHEVHDWFLNMMRDHEEFEVETDRAGELPLSFCSETYIQRMFSMAKRFNLRSQVRRAIVTVLFAMLAACGGESTGPDLESLSVAPAVVMTLDPEFTKQTTDLIEQTLELYKTSGASPRVGEIWDCASIGDFLCGFFVGEMVGSALSAFQIVHHREPTADEHLEIIKLVENHSNEIKEFFSKFN